MIDLFEEINGKTEDDCVSEVLFISWVNILTTVVAIWSTCSIQFVLSHIDNAIQYGEDAEPKARDHDPGGDDGGGF